MIHKSSNPSSSSQELPSVVELRIRSLAFVLRCTAAAAFTYKIAVMAGFSYPLWGAISSLIVSQEEFLDTRQVLSERVRGTCLGVIISFLTHFLTIPLGISLLFQLSIAVAICAAISQIYHGMRVCIWTCPIVFLSGQVMDQSVINSGIYRALEIIVGCLIGGAFHWFSEIVMNWLFPHPRISS